MLQPINNSDFLICFYLYLTKTSHELHEMIIISLTVFSNASRNMEPHAGTVENFDKLTKVDEAQRGRGLDELETTEMMLKEYCVFVYLNGLCKFLAWGLGDDKMRVEITAVNRWHDKYSESGKSQSYKETLVTSHVLS